MRVFLRRSAQFEAPDITKQALEHIMRFRVGTRLDDPRDIPIER